MGKARADATRSAMRAVLTPEIITREMRKSTAYMGKLTMLKNYAMFMGKAQLIEFKLKLAYSC